jgi:AAA family ATP:ADP antiporter
VYVVFPASIAFLLAFTAVSSRCSRGRTFNIVVGAFLSFFVLFGVVLFPLRDTLHPHAFADTLAAALPAGLAGGVACIRHWTYTLFYVAAELWGDVVLSLLFWGLANDTTRLHEAPILYPLFGIGANVAQTAAGLCLKALGAATALAAAGDADAAWALQLRALCAVTVGACVAIMGLHAWILRRAQAGGTARGAAASGATGGSAAAAAAPPLDASAPAGQRRSAPSLRESLATVGASPQVRSLAACALASGVAQCLMEFAWKGHLRALHPTPTGYAAYMGDVATATGALTACMMLVSPVLFSHLGWRGAAGVLPRILLWGGAAFFGGAIWRAHAPAALGDTLLPFVVFAGAILFVFSRAAKYALFKPAEEMVYIRLSDDARTRGKAAVDVVANQAGKSGGSLFNQGLLLMCAGSLPAVLPLMLVAFLACVTRWMGAVSRLADTHLAPPAAAEAEAHDGGDADDAPALVQAQVEAPAEEEGGGAAGAVPQGLRAA